MVIFEKITTKCFVNKTHKDKQDPGMNTIIIESIFDLSSLVKKVKIVNVIDIVMVYYLNIMLLSVLGWKIKRQV